MSARLNFSSPNAGDKIFTRGNFSRGARVPAAEINKDRVIIQRSNVAASIFSVLNVPPSLPSLPFLPSLFVNLFARNVTAYPWRFATRISQVIHYRLMPFIALITRIRARYARFIVAETFRAEILPLRVNFFVRMKELKGCIFVRYASCLNSN